MNQKDQKVQQAYDNMKKVMAHVRDSRDARKAWADYKAAVAAASK